MKNKLFDVQKHIDDKNMDAIHQFVENQKSNNTLFPDECVQLIKRALLTDDADIVKAFIPIVPENWDACTYFLYALEYRSSSAILNVLQPSAEDQWNVIDKLRFMRFFDELLYWSQTKNDHCLDHKITQYMADEFYPIPEKFKKDVQNILDHIQLKIANEQKDFILGCVNSAPNSCIRSRKM